MENKDYEVKQCLCCWYDLLGYGSPFVKSKWDLNNESCKSNFYRIENLRLLFTTSLAAKPLGTRLTFNDGFASTIDVDPITSDSYYESLLFLEGAIQDFEAINLDDKRRNFPGVRGIITLGQRFSYDCCNSSYDLLSKRTTSYHPMEFQMNTAFSKAFLMEESGSKAGISGNNLYIDIEVFHYLKSAALEIGCASPQVETDCNELVLQVHGPMGWFAELRFDPTPIEYGESKDYKNQGIETKLYRFKKMHSVIDDWAKEAAYQQALRNSKMEEDSDCE